MTLARTERRQDRKPGNTDLVDFGEHFGLYRALCGEPVSDRALAAGTFADIDFIRERVRQQIRERCVTSDTATSRYAKYCRLPQAA